VATTIAPHREAPRSVEATHATGDLHRMRAYISWWLEECTQSLER